MKNKFYKKCIKKNKCSTQLLNFIHMFYPQSDITVKVFARSYLSLKSLSSDSMLDRFHKRIKPLSTTDLSDIACAYGMDK